MKLKIEGLWGDNFLKGLLLFLICLILMGQNSFAEQKLDEDITRSLIIRQLLNLIDWRANVVLRSASPHYALCTYKDGRAFRNLSTHLQRFAIESIPVSVRQVSNKENLSFCNVVYLNHPNESLSDWVLANKLNDHILFIVEGKEIARKGFHIGFYLNENKTFDIELNPDVLIHSNFKPSRELFKVSRLTESKTAEKINLLRSLINYTDWPSNNAIFDQDKLFELCVFEQPTFEVFVDFFTQERTFKNRKLISRNITSNDQLTSCNAIFFNSNRSQNISQFLLQRTFNKMLLIGNDISLGEKGVHYNLAPKAIGQNRRFEINLTAFEQTGHTPRFELLNSGFVVERDYPEIFKILFSIIQQTEWPQSSSFAQKLSLQVCISSNLEGIENLQMFLPERQLIFAADKTVLKPIILRQFDKTQDLTDCAVILARSISEAEYQFIETQNSENLPLLIVNQAKTNNSRWFHYNLFIDPKNVSFELNLELLKAQGFVPATILQKAAQLVQGVKR